MDNTQTVISFCTGYGGLELGVKRVLPNVRTIAYVEIEAFAVANLVAKIEEGKLDAAPVWTNLKTFSARKFRNKVRGITAGYPCQPFSIAGKRKGESDPRHLFPYLLQHIETIRPVWAFFENVGGHLQLGFAEVYRSLRGLGYAVESFLCSASELHGSFTGRRLYIMASTNGMWEPQPEGCEQDKRRRIIDSGETLAQTESKGLQNGGESRTKETRTRLTDRSCHVRGVAWQGQEQYEWEEPRTVESGMGRTVDGFRSRVDELRLLGNGVVPTQAELAFRTLLKRIQAERDKYALFREQQ